MYNGKKKKKKSPTMINKTLHKKLKFELHEPHENMTVNSDIVKG